MDALQRRAQHAEELLNLFNGTKGNLIKAYLEKFPGSNIDTALPNEWVKNVREVEINIHEYVWLYDNESLDGRPVTMWYLACKIMGK